MKRLIPYAGYDRFERPTRIERQAKAFRAAELREELGWEPDRIAKLLRLTVPEVEALLAKGRQIQVGRRRIA